LLLLLAAAGAVAPAVDAACSSGREQAARPQLAAVRAVRVFSAERRLVAKVMVRSPSKGKQVEGCSVGFDAHQANEGLRIWLGGASRMRGPQPLFQ
jgi:hypothetical protein